MCSAVNSGILNGFFPNEATLADVRPLHKESYPDKIIY